MSSYIDKLNNKRIEKSLSVYKLSELCGMPMPTVKKILAKKNVPSVENVRKIAVALNISLAQLFCNSNEVIIRSTDDKITFMTLCESLSKDALRHLSWFISNLKT